LPQVLLVLLVLLVKRVQLLLLPQRLLNVRLLHVLLLHLQLPHELLLLLRLLPPSPWQQPAQLLLLPQRLLAESLPRVLLLLLRWQQPALSRGGRSVEGGRCVEGGRGSQRGEQRVGLRGGTGGGRGGSHRRFCGRRGRRGCGGLASRSAQLLVDRHVLARLLCAACAGAVAVLGALQVKLHGTP
tara:strand:+ start:245 stop:799 length:555 start_codon:yes stop_codon:yes gene_type:complete